VSVDKEEWPPPDILAFETYLRVRFHELDALGHVNNANYLNYVEQAAIDHAAFLGLGMNEMRELGGVFVARRHEIDYLRSAVAGETLRIITWLGVPHGASVDRSYLVLQEPQLRGVLSQDRIIRGEDVPRTLPLVARARTAWVFVDSAGRPRRIPPQVMDRFAAAHRHLA
jgi:acyl-CoA thioester hydrolase